MGIVNLVLDDYPTHSESNINLTTITLWLVLTAYGAYPKDLIKQYPATLPSPKIMKSCQSTNPFLSPLDAKNLA